LKRIRGMAEKGWIAVEGLEVLPVQAFAQFELWTGRGAPRRVMREAMEKAYSRFHENQLQGDTE
jgi:shikimate 5-dehydrogenase